jgi:hypothetical protein
VTEGIGSVDTPLHRAVLVQLAARLNLSTTGTVATLRDAIVADLSRRAAAPPAVVPPAALAAATAAMTATAAVAVPPAASAVMDVATAAVSSSGKAYGSAVIAVPPDAHHGVSQHVRRSWFDSADASAPRRWRAVDADVARTALPAFTDDLLQFLFATPSVSPSPFHSATANRAAGFTDGLANHSRDDIRLHVDVPSRRALLYNRCAASMSSGTLHHCFFSYTVPPLGATTTWGALRASYRGACTCKNGETTGNCGHIAGLVRRIALLQGGVARGNMRHARAVASHANSSVLPRALERAVSLPGASKSNKRRRASA